MEKELYDKFHADHAPGYFAAPAAVKQGRADELWANMGSPFRESIYGVNWFDYMEPVMKFTCEPGEWTGLIRDVTKLLEEQLPEKPKLKPTRLNKTCDACIQCGNICCCCCVFCRDEDLCCCDNFCRACCPPCLPCACTAGPLVFDMAALRAQMDEAIAQAQKLVQEKTRTWRSSGNATLKLVVNTETQRHDLGDSPAKDHFDIKRITYWPPVGVNLVLELAEGTNLLKKWPPPPRQKKMKHGPVYFRQEPGLGRPAASDEGGGDDDGDYGGDDGGGYGGGDED